jgi:hypothetical protein
MAKQQPNDQRKPTSKPGKHSKQASDAEQTQRFPQFQRGVDAFVADDPADDDAGGGK